LKSNQGLTGRAPLTTGPPPPRGAVKRGSKSMGWDHECGVRIEGTVGVRDMAGARRGSTKGHKGSKAGTYKPVARRFNPPVHVVVVLDGNEKIDGWLITWGRWLKLKANNDNTLLVNPRYVKTVEFLRNKDGEVNDHEDAKKQKQ